MKKPAELYVICEPEAPAATNVIPIGAIPRPPPRERSWRDLMRRLQKNPAPRARP
jgi:hypothetical protein